MTKNISKKLLRKGWTTGACATAATAAAYEALLSERFPNPVTISLPKGEKPSFKLSKFGVEKASAFAAVIKDAGDDPDITHGAEIISTITPGPAGSGVTFFAGEGVGTITLAGLTLAVGEPAINPGPREMINNALKTIATHHGMDQIDLAVTISIPGGQELAKKTMNPRLGIIGGLSILGTNGVVIPYSCSAWVHAIHCGVDVARALKLDHIIAATGRASEAGARKLNTLPDAAYIEMGDFAGALLKYLRKHPINHLTLVGGFAKMTKLAQGNLDLHSSRSQVDFDALDEMLDQLGAPKRTSPANTASQVLTDAGEFAPSLAALVARRAREVALATLSGDITVNVTIFDRNSKILAQSQND